ncbi:MAG: efflux RND transporter periplasmic adaptor subunit [Bacillota bacterium]|nr:efflux RND transporter periplasmic adaptor subunit [Bacillota bacterium]
MNAKKSVKYGIVFSVMISTALLSGCSMFPSEEAQLDPPLIKPKAVAVELATAEKKDIDKYITGYGSLTSTHDMPLFSKQSGLRLKEIYVKSGDMVKKGQLVAELDSGDLESKIKIEQYNLDKAQLKYEQIQNGNDNYAIKMAKDDLLIEQQSVSNLQEQLQKTKFISPIDGQVSFIEKMQPGDMVEAYKPIVVISDPSKLQLYYQSNESSIQQVKKGMKAQITYNNSTLTGEVVTSPEDAPPNVSDKMKNAVIINVDNLPTDAKMGDTMQFSVAVESKKDAIVIPIEALEQFGSSCKVAVQDKNAQKEVSVQIGIQNSKEVEIVSGISEGQKVVLNK